MSLPMLACDPPALFSALPMLACNPRARPPPNKRTVDAAPQVQVPATPRLGSAWSRAVKKLSQRTMEPQGETWLVRDEGRSASSSESEGERGAPVWLSEQAKKELAAEMAKAE